MKKLNPYFYLIVLFLALTLMSFHTVQAQTSPVIDIWYGDTQKFGNIGEPQVWCNILGNIMDDGTITSFTYSLNGGTPVDLNIGPDNRRLENSGDFNIDIAATDLLPGSNTVLITAIDDQLNTSTKTVTINYTDGNVWPIPYDIDWSSLNNDITQINDVSHVVDGKFLLTPDGVRTDEPGYDRLIALGDKTSTNYEVLVPITIHSMESDGGVGVLLRWKGHTSTPVSCTQPQCGYFPLGAISWFRSNRLEFYQGNSVGFTRQLEVTYMFRTSVETDAVSGNTNYRIKFWEQGTAEPDAWNLEQTEGTSDLQEGSLMLIAHKTDVTFGDVIVTPGSLSISNVQTQLSNNNTEATITWNTNQPASSRVDYGPTAVFEDGFVEDTNLVTTHSITLTGLTADTIYQYKISGSNSVESVERTDLILSTFTSGIKSDDFCGNTLDAVWTFDNPLNDANFALTGSGTNDAFLEIAVPAGPEHQIFTSGINAPNLMQTINNSDFEVEVKFESGVISPQYQQQGILVKESDTRYLRFEFYSKDDEKTYLYAQAFSLTGAQAAFVNDDIFSEGAAPLYMRVKRVGNQWTLSYSENGTDFIIGATFFNDMVPTQIGPYAGNATGNSSPAHTAKIDYFLNIDDPISAEDGCDAPQPPVLAAIGNQLVDEESSLQLTLTATDGDGDDASIVFSELGLPSFCLLTDNNDGTATLSIDPQLGDAGTFTTTITVTDADGLTDSEAFDIVVNSIAPSNLVSDDFCDNTLNSIWTFNDPLVDADFELTGSGTNNALLEISVPGGLEHQLWEDGILAPHVLQASNNTDFELEVKMDSPVNAPQYQQQGIIVKQDDNNFLRFEMYSSNSNTQLLAAILEGTGPPLTSALPIVNINIGDLNTTAPVYMRVTRVGNLWTQSYSFDGATWETAGSFNHTLVVSGVGLYSGNALGASSPGHTAKFDYFLNSVDPISDEDGCDAPQSPVLAAIGDQSVQEGSTLPLTLMATDADGNDVDIVFSETGLPSFASLTNNNDGTATIDINPQLGDAGTYPVTITVTDNEGFTDEETFDIIVSSGTVSSLVSDDFCDDELNPAWTFIDPQSDGSFALTGSGTSNAYLEISVPADSSHEMWTSGIQAPHVLQTCNNTDFEIEVKLDSGVTSPQFQEQGILIKQDEFNFLRFEFFSTDSNTRIFASILQSPSNTLPLNSNNKVNADVLLLNTAPLYMRIKREGDLWTQWYSTDGSTWEEAVNFTHALVVSGIGLYSGNAGTHPAHTAQFDYFKNLADPITNEDNCCITTTAATWNGSVSSNWDDINNWTPNEVPTECSVITIPLTANPPTITGTTVVKDVNIDAGSNMVVPSGASLTISGDLNMFSGSNSYSGLVVNGDVIVEGTAKYHRYTNANLNRNDLIAPPLAGQTWSSFLTSDGNYNANILFNDGVAIPNTQYLFGPFEKGTTDDYVIYNYNDVETLTLGRGYRAATNTPEIDGNGEPLIFTGELFNSEVEVGISDDISGAFHEWNLIGNPYPAYLDVDAFLNHVGTVSGVTNLSLLAETTAAIYGYNADTSVSIWTITNLVEGPELIAPGQGFFVSSKNPSASLEFTKDMQVLGNSDDFILGREANDTNFIKLKAMSTDEISSISVYFHDNGSTGLDIGYDAAVFGGSIPEFSLFSHLVEDNEGVPMVIQTLHSDDINDVIIPLSFHANQGQQITFSLDSYDLPSSVEVYLEDNVNNTYTLLNTSSYVFTSGIAINGSGRFFLHFTSDALSVGEASLNALNIYTNQENRNIVIEGNLLGLTKASVFDLLGRRVLLQELDTSLNKNSLDANTLSSGVYVVKLQDGNQQLTKKVILK
ncbi:T9SS type A sorting domain-containing protein [Winogradskyella aurantia]|uniref:Fibronectin type-III domain-containing protein n=1 Tax=Winogradskyella aurantia TaxID=1915063 RepID=A0A265US62_9FLAO|nr:T9SS type A sorting domain-containing protein [Winogradskyella aurantia]OZV68145.1 hypothetical protein CA834_10895 [Winogradskyella aurantia]